MTQAQLKRKYADTPTASLKGKREDPAIAEHENVAENRQEADEEEQEEDISEEEKELAGNTDDWDEEAPFRSTCRCNVRDTLVQELGMSQADATEYAKSSLDLSVGSVTWEESNEVRSVTASASFDPPVGAPKDARPVKVSIQYHLRARYSSVEFFVFCKVNGKSAWGNRLLDECETQKGGRGMMGWFGDFDEEEEEEDDFPEQQYDSQFNLKSSTVKAIAKHFAPWGGAKGDAKKAGKAGGKDDKDFEKKIFKVIFSGVGVDWGKGARSPFSSIHEDGDEWFEDNFNKM